MELTPMQNEADRKQLRSFGLTVGGIFGLIGVWPVVVRSVGPRWWSIIIAGVLIGSAFICPRSLFSIHKYWMRLGHILGWINTRIILGVVFFVVVTPIGIMRRLFGKDPMGRHTRPELDSYRIIRKPRPASHLTKQY
jgi:hypothetical protein